MQFRKFFRLRSALVPRQADLALSYVLQIFSFSNKVGGSGYPKISNYPPTLFPKTYFVKYLFQAPYIFIVKLNLTLLVQKTVLILITAIF